MALLHHGIPDYVYVLAYTAGPPAILLVICYCLLFFIRICEVLDPWVLDPLPRKYSAINSVTSIAT